MNERVSEYERGVVVVVVVPVKVEWGNSRPHIISMYYGVVALRLRLP
jgi:hypothetical protein